MDDLAHSTFIFPRSSIAAMSSSPWHRWHVAGGRAPRAASASKAVLPARIGDLAAFIGSFRKAMHARIPEFRCAAASGSA
jgi:uroporphyrin-III C-methyltransferase/precorrin-2 dehydrogenase/sirohydrochlorin ferrochelatase